MKKVTKMSLRDLAKEMPVLSELEQSAFVGGDKLVFDKAGHYIETVWDGNDYNTVNIEGTNSGYILGSETTFSSYEYKDDNGSTATGFMFSGADIGLFEFFAGGTDVEWAYSYNEDDKDEDAGILNTTHSTNSVQGLYSSGFDSFTHSHPNGETGFSDEDRNTFEGLRNRYGYENFSSYAPGLENENDRYSVY